MDVEGIDGAGLSKPGLRRLNSIATKPTDIQGVDSHKDKPSGD